MVNVTFTKGMERAVVPKGCLTMYDKGRTLRIYGLDLPPVCSIDFSFGEKHGLSIPQDAFTVDGVTTVKIPDRIFNPEYFTEDYVAFAYIYILDKTVGMTVKSIMLNIEARPKPEGYDFEIDVPDFQETIQKVSEISEVTIAARDKTLEYMNDAGEDAERAEAAADRAEIASDKAEEYRNESFASAVLAEGYKDEAKIFADSAIASAASADETKEAVEEMVEEVINARNDTYIFRDDAQSSAESAELSKTQAKTYRDETEVFRNEVASDKVVIDENREVVETLAAETKAARDEAVVLVDNAETVFDFKKEEALSQIETAKTEAVDEINDQEEETLNDISATKTSAVNAVELKKQESLQVLDDMKHIVVVDSPEEVTDQTKIVFETNKDPVIIEFPDGDTVEKKQNKVTSITEDNKNSTEKYTSIKAVNDYVEPLKADLDALTISRGNNIIPIENFIGKTFSGAGVTINVLEDGSFLLNGTATSGVSIEIVPNRDVYAVLKANTAYRLKAKKLGGYISSGGVYAYIGTATSGAKYYNTTAQISYGTFTPNENDELNRFAINVSAGVVLDNYHMVVYMCNATDWIDDYVGYDIRINGTKILNADGNYSRLAVISCNPSYYPIPIMFDTISRACIIGAGNIVIGKNIKGVLTEESVLNLSIENGIIVWDTTDNEMKVIDRTSNISDVQIIIATYGNYGAIVSCPTYHTIDGNPYGIDTSPKYEEKYPNYEYIKLNNATWWSDFIVINDELWVFTPSSDEEHTNANGKIAIYNHRNGSFNYSFKHDFGHCNTVHYNPNNDKLIIGNLPGNSAYQSALYIFDDVSLWRSKPNDSTLRFSDLNPTIIDLSALGNNASQTVACWGENNMDQNNIVYISGNFNTDWWKLLLGYGANDLGNGTFKSDLPNYQLNGTYKVIWHKTFGRVYNANQEVIQGIDYSNGVIKTSNGHNELQWWDWNVKDDSMTRVENKAVPYNADGTIKYCVSEGFCVNDGYAYVGCIFTNAAHTSGAGELGIIKTKL